MKCTKQQHKPVLLIRVSRNRGQYAGSRVSVGDGTLTIVAKDQLSMDRVLEKIEFIVGREIEVGGIYKGIVTSVKEYGAFVEFNGGQQGLLHISELSHGPVFLDISIIFFFMKHMMYFN